MKEPTFDVKPSPLSYDAHGTPYMQRPSLWEKCKKEPLVPIGCGLTALALGLGIRSFRRGDIKNSQRMMRVRVAAQGFTILVVAYSAFYTTRAHHERLAAAQRQAELDA